MKKINQDSIEIKLYTEIFSYLGVKFVCFCGELCF